MSIASHVGPIMVIRVQNDRSLPGQAVGGRTAMDALGRSAELLRRGDKLRARSMRARAAAERRWRTAGS